MKQWHNRDRRAHTHKTKFKNEKKNERNNENEID